MKQETIKDFTRRISQCNKGSMIVIIYDIVFAYIEDAKQSYVAGDHEGFKNALRKAQRAVDELIHALNFQYEVSKNLYSLYVFSKETMAKAIVKNSTDEMCIRDSSITVSAIYRNLIGRQL